MSSRHEDELIAALSRRAPIDLPAPATDAVVREAEAAIGVPLPSFYVRLLREIGNGGFGPGLGLLGLRGECAGSARHDALALREFLWSDDRRGPPVGVLPLCDWGCATWSLMDAALNDGEVLSMELQTIVDTSRTLVSWLQDWLDGVDILERMQTYDTVESVHPFTKKLVTRRQRRGLRGTPYVPHWK